MKNRMQSFVTRGNNLVQNGKDRISHEIDGKRI